jgi:prepilin signal peptidase PulO-like enzyme (type II secretory pathway)
MSYSRQCLLAIILSLPFVLLMWGVISFLVAVILFSWLGSTQKRGDDETSIPHGISVTIVVFSIFIALIASVSVFIVRMLHVHTKVTVISA